MKRKLSKKSRLVERHLDTDDVVYESVDESSSLSDDQLDADMVYDYEDDGSQWGLQKRLSKKERRSKAARMIAQLESEGYVLEPAKAANGRQIAITYWGQAWCEHLKLYSDYHHRLERGRSYLRTNSVVDLKIENQKITAKVSGHSLYDVEVDFVSLGAQRWQDFIKRHSASIESLADLLEGALPERVLTAASNAEVGLFPSQKEIKFWCSCPDHADMCKHVAAVLYGVGARLDERPEEFFVLRGVNVNDLLKQAGHAMIDLREAMTDDFDKEALESLFNIDIKL